MYYVTDVDLLAFVEEHRIAFIEFYTDKSAESRAQRIIDEEILKEFQEKYGEDVTIGRMELELNVETVEQYNIDAVPSFMIFRNGKQIEDKSGTDRIIGLLSQDGFREIVKGLEQE